MTTKALEKLYIIGIALVILTCASLEEAEAASIREAYKTYDMVKHKGTYTTRIKNYLEVAGRPDFKNQNIAPVVYMAALGCPDVFQSTLPITKFQAKAYRMLNPTISVELSLEMDRIINAWMYYENIVKYMEKEDIEHYAPMANPTTTSGVVNECVALYQDLTKENGIYAYSISPSLATK